MRRALLLCAVVLLAACSQAEPASTSTAPAEVGQVVEYGPEPDGARGTVTLVSATWGASDARHGAAQAGAYLTLDVEVSPVSGDVRAGPAYFTARDTTGRTWTSGPTLRKPALPSGMVPAGTTNRGYVTLDVPPVALVVQWISADGIRAAWSVPAPA